MSKVSSSIIYKREVIGEHNGYPIFKETAITLGKFHPLDKKYDTTYVKTKRDYYGFCVKGGNVNKTSDRIYERFSFTYLDVMREMANIIDDFEKGNVIMLTEKENYDWVDLPNKRNQYGFTYNGLLRIMIEYKKASEKRKFAYLERLTDANFHTERQYLEDENYDEYMNAIIHLK